MNSFIYNIPTKVYFGENQLGNLGKELTKFGKRVLLTYGGGSIKRSGLYDRVIAELRGAGMEIFELSGIEPNPRIDSVREGVKICKEQSVDVLLAVGGGSTIDATKFMAAGACVEHDPWEFFGANAKPIERALPIVTILTLSATGSEMDTAGVISNLETGDKLGRLAQPLLPKVSFLDPTLTYSVSKYQTACGIVDIMSHTMERYFTVCPDVPLTDSIAEALLRSVIDAGKIVVQNSNDYNARATLMWASSLSHNGLTSCGRENFLAVHQLEHAVSGEYDSVAHGAGLAVLFPAWAKYVYKYNVPRFAQFARNVWGVVEDDDTLAAQKGIVAMAEYFVSIGMPSRLSEFGIEKGKEDRLADLCTNGKTRSIKNYIPLGYKEVKEIFESCY